MAGSGRGAPPMLGRMPHDVLLEVADELYGLPLPEFTPTRDARSKALKATDKALSAAVKTLRKPSVAAWVVNLLVRREAEQVEQVLGLAAALREAQTGLDGAELRALTRQRRQLTAAVTTRARALAADQGHRTTQAVADQVEETLTAALIDEGCATAVRSGLLVHALTATGVGEADIADAVAVPEALGFVASPRAAAEPQRPELHVVPDPDAEAKARGEAEDRLAEAEQGVASARVEWEQAVAGVGVLESRGMQVQAEIDELRRRLAELEQRLEEVDDQLAGAEDERAEAQASLDEATRVRDAAAAALARLV